MMCDEIDLEDIECRLYSQFYHCSSENEETNLPQNVTSCAIDKRYNNRYFCNDNIRAFIPLEQENGTNTDRTYSSVHSNNTVTNLNPSNINTARNFVGQFENNITVNQYTLPVIINSDLNEILSPNYRAARFFVPWNIENKVLLNKKGRKRQRRLENRRQKNKEKRNQHSAENICINTNKNVKSKVTDIVCISDDSESECIIINEMCKKKSNIRKEPRCINTPGNPGSESDDDIIYIPPPPVEVINVDENTNEAIQNPELVAIDNVSNSTDLGKTDSESVNKLLEAPEICTSNDFLDNVGIENNTSNFNFSLHGSDFNNTGDFLRPANPADYCETESSCSTNDFNRENNSVKTVVFNEVDFPREDIFSDKNLEGFSTYITPKRNSVKKSKVPSRSPKSTTKTVSDNESSSTSSESDYEPPDICKIAKTGDMDSIKKLPVLSPMQCDKIGSADTKGTKSKYDLKSHDVPQALSPNIRKRQGKRKSNVIVPSESDSDTDVDTVKTSKLPKKKKKPFNKHKSLTRESNKSIDNEVQSTTNKYSGSGSSSNEESVNTSVCSTNKKIAEKIIAETRVANKSDEHSDGSKDNENVDTNVATVFCKKKKKKSINSKKSEMDSTSVSSSSETTLHKTKLIKKKIVSSENSIDSMNISISELNRSWVGIADINIENELSNGDNTLDSSKDNPSSSKTVSKEPQRAEKLIVSVDNNSNSDNIVSTCEFENIEKGVVEVQKNEEPKSFGISSLDVSEESEIDEDIIVIDEVFSDVNTEDEVEIVVSSDSECDFKDMRDVGLDLKLANCSSRKGNDVGITETEVTSSVMNKNLCEDYNQFDVEQIQNTQSDDPNLWKISPSDQLMFLEINKSKGPRCNRCRRFGHIAWRCTEKPDPPSCSLCGFPGHQEPRCPNKRCTECGTEGDYSTTYCWKCVKFRNSICRTCRMKGHIAKFCPDLWRRYHLTTEDGPIVVSQEPQLKPKEQLWCSGCAGQGHLEHECNYYRVYPPVNPCIFSYEDVLHREGRNNSSPVPHPPPVCNTQQRDGFSNVSPLLGVPSTSQNISCPSPIFIPPLMSQIQGLGQIYPIPPVPTMLDQNQMVIPSTDVNCNPNFIPVSNKVLNPFSVLVQQGGDTPNCTILDQMMSDYINDGGDINHVGFVDNKSGKRIIYPHMVKHGTSEWLRNDQRRIKQIIMSMPAHAVKQFLRKELDDLENVVSQSNPKFLKKKLFKYDRLAISKRALTCEVVKERCFWFRILNIFIFGVHQFRDGKIHINYIKKYLSEPKQNRLDNHKRKSLLNAYNYIFDADRRSRINYYDIMNKIIHRDSGES